jgi:5'-nucleotidase (lipoprotein e(P4) family)
MSRKRECAALMLALALAACRSTPSMTIVPPPERPVYPDRQQRIAQQNTDAVIYQHTSAEVLRLYEQCYELARLRLDANLQRPHTLPAAVVVDIDETVLDNSPFQVTNTALGRTYAPGNWSDWVMMGSAKALPGALTFLHYAAEKGCEVFYISNRSASEKNATIKNLHELLFPNTDDAHVLCMDGTDSDKTKRRARVSEGHYIALLVGDQLRDFDEGFKDRSTDYGRDRVTAMHDTLLDYFIMLPNPMYGTWLDAVSGKVDSLKLGRKSEFFEQNKY